MMTVQFKDPVTQEVLYTFTKVERVFETVVPSHIGLSMGGGYNSSYPIEGQVVCITKEKI